MPNATDAFTARLENLASAIRARSTVQERLIGACDCATIRDYHAESLVAAFLALTDAGGDPDQPELFDWQGREAKFAERGRRVRFVGTLKLMPVSKRPESSPVPEQLLRGSAREGVRFPTFQPPCIEAPLKPVQPKVRSVTQ